MLPQRSLICPHCMTENPAFGAQRCQSCGLAMMSNQLHALREQKIKPLSKQLDAQLLQLRAGKDQKAAVSYARELYNSLSAYASYEELSFLAPQLAEAKEALAPFPVNKQKDRRSFVTWIVLLILFLFPLGAFLLYDSALLALLLSLTFFGWLFIAVIPEMKRKRAIK